DAVARRTDEAVSNLDEGVLDRAFAVRRDLICRARLDDDGGRGGGMASDGDRAVVQGQLAAGRDSDGRLAAAMGSLRVLVGDQQVQSLQMQGTGAKVEEDRPGGGGLRRECGGTKPNAGAPGTRLGLDQPLCRSRKLRHR